MKSFKDLFLFESWKKSTKCSLSHQIFWYLKSSPVFPICVYVSMLSHSSLFIFQLAKQCRSLPENQNTWVTFKKCSPHFPFPGELNCKSQTTPRLALRAFGLGFEARKGTAACFLPLVFLWLGFTPPSGLQGTLHPGPTFHHPLAFPLCRRVGGFTLF